MPDPAFLKVWRIPCLLAASTTFGLLSALLGTGVWHLLSWITISIPLALTLRKILAAGK
jgi:hypothetical protein